MTRRSGFAMSSRFGEESKWEKTLHKISKQLGHILQSIGDATYPFRYKAKDILYKTPNEKKLLNSDCGRLCPKAWLVALGLALAAFATFSFVLRLVPDEVVLQIVPWALTLKQLPIWACFLLALLGGWMVGTHPMRTRKHGVLDFEKKRLDEMWWSRDVDRDTIENKYLTLYCKAISNIVQTVQPPSQSMMYAEMRGCDILIEALTFDAVPMDFSPYHPANTHKRDAMTENLSRQDIKDMYQRYDDACKKAYDIVQIWTSKSTGLGDAKISVHSLEASNMREVSDAIRELGDKLGIESSIDAYMSGVPIEDLIS